MRSRTHVEAGVIVGSLDPVDFRDFHKRDLADALDGETLQFSWRVFTALQGLLRPVEGTLESSVIERLEKIVERSGFKSSNCILIVSGHENDCRRKIVAQHFKYVETVAFRHLHIEEQQIRPGGADTVDGLATSATFADEFNLRIPPSAND